jgi:hypothetical protein
MASRSRDLFLTVRSEGAILPPDFLERVVSGDGELDGLTPEDYHLARGEKLNEVISRSWNRLLGAWVSFRNATGHLPETDVGTSITRERWLQPLFQELGYGRLLTAKAIEIAGKSYPISHRWNRTPIHLLGCRVDLDRPTPRLAGASRTSPHSLVQEALNRSREFVWGLLSNGLLLRILRDNASLSRQAYVEFDLEAMMLGENYADFVLLWLLCHQSRVEAENPHDCWLEKWSQISKERGVRALDQLRQGVESAISALGRGFLSHPSNRVLKDRLRSGSLTTQDYYRQLLRLVYRFLFLFSAEDRGLLLLLGDQNADARERFLAYYSTARLRRLAERRTGTRHTDLYTMIRLVMGRLGTDVGYPELALPALGSFLFSAPATADLDSCELTNLDLCDAIRALAITIANGVRRPVDYKNLGPEELGSIYESLLELHPRVNIDAASFDLEVATGHERKTTGSYYTPTNLIECLLNSALDPVLDKAAKNREPAKAILALKVVDPACGSGHFLIAAAHRIAKRLACVRTGDDEPSPEATRAALRDAIGHCIHGVDTNPMAVELCKVSLWMEALEPGKPLSFLEHRIQCGNSLFGATPGLLKMGIPDGAFKPIEGDDPEICREFKRINQDERIRQTRFFSATTEPWQQLGNFAASLTTLDGIADDSIDSIRKKEKLYEEAVRSSGYLYGQLWADSWCAAFVWKKTKQFNYPITEEVFRRIEANPFACEPWMRVEIQRLASEYRFLHWHMAFPDVFHIPTEGEEPDNEIAGWNGGFDVVLGNPPWDQVQFREQEFFASVRADIAQAATGAKRKTLIKDMALHDVKLHELYASAHRSIDGLRMFVQQSGQYPLTGHGRINVFSLFVERNILITNSTGGLGCIVPSGIASDDSCKLLFQHLVDTNLLRSLFDFENSTGLFPEIDSRTKFSLLTVRKHSFVEDESSHASFGFFLDHPDQTKDEERVFTITSAEIKLLNPNTRTCPILRSRRDADLMINIYRRFPVLLAEGLDIGNPWSITTKPGLFNMSGDSLHFASRQTLEAQGWILNGNQFRKGGLTYVPLYEGKMAASYDHRAADVIISATARLRQGQPEELSKQDHESPDRYAIPRHWVPSADVEKKLKGQWKRSWILGWKEVTSSTNERTLIPGIYPRVGIGHKIPIILPQPPFDEIAHLLFANLSSCVCDYVARNKLGTTSLTPFTIKQLPVLPPGVYLNPTDSFCIGGLRAWIERRLLELLYTAWDLSGFAKDLGCLGPPFRWSDERRVLLRCELDALYFHLYRISRKEVEYIVDTFPIVRRKDEQQYGDYRTKRVILEVYDAMAQATRSGAQYETAIHPPPADSRLAHSSSTAPSQPLYSFQSQEMPLLDTLRMVADNAWATPLGVTPQNVALFALIDVLRSFAQPIDSHQVRTAALLVRKPALALAFLGRAEGKEWVRIVGSEAQPLSRNVVDISQFQPNAVDHAWTEAFNELSGADALLTHSGVWSSGANLPESSGEEWVSGRAAIAVRLSTELIADQAVEQIDGFLRSVRDGAA